MYIVCKSFPSYVCVQFYSSVFLGKKTVTNVCVYFTLQISVFLGRETDITVSQFLVITKVE